MSAAPTPSSSRPSLLLRAVRWYVPLAVIVAGIVIFALDPSLTTAEGSAGLIGAGLAWLLFGWLYRKGEEGDVDRDVEEAAREYLEQHGEWPSDEQYAHFERYGRWPA